MVHKNKFEILKAFALMNKEKYFVKNIEGKVYSYNPAVKDDWLNFALLENSISKKELEVIEKFFIERNRSPSIYFSEDIKEEMNKTLEESGYRITNKDSWMFWNQESPQINIERIIEVKTDEDFNKWIDTFVKSYPKDDPKNPYGEQTEFAKGLEKYWKEGKTRGDRYFLAFEQNNPVAVGILTSYNKMGYISAIGSVPSARGKGFAKKISLHCVKESFKQGNKLHFLATEKGDYPFEFYKRIGFEPEFVAYLFTKR